MKLAKTFQVKVSKDGKILLNNQEEFEKYVLFRLAEKECILTIQEKKYVRSLSQNNLLWLYYGIIEEDLGVPSQELHEIFKKKFLPPKFISLKGKEYEISGSTANLDKMEFQDYLDKICAETNVPIPDTKKWLYGNKKI